MCCVWQVVKTPTVISNNPVYNGYCFPTSVVFVDTAAMLNAKHGRNLSGRPIEAVSLATFAYCTVYTLKRPVQTVAYPGILFGGGVKFS